jgi:hypothetical protein
MWGLGYLVLARVMVLNATFNNISVISWWSVLLVEKYHPFPSLLPGMVTGDYHQFRNFFSYFMTTRLNGGGGGLRHSFTVKPVLRENPTC